MNYELHGGEYAVLFCSSWDMGLQLFVKNTPGGALGVLNFRPPQTKPVLHPVIYITVPREFRFSNRNNIG